MEILEEIVAGIKKGDPASVHALTEKALSQGISAEDILNKGLVAGMDIISEMFKKGEIFIPEVLIAAKAMKAGMEIIKPLLAKSNVEAKGKVVIGTVKGDLHDIGKNIVAMLLEGSGYEIIDLGNDVPKEKFLEHVEKEGANVLGMSALLTTTMTYMGEVIESIEKAGLKQKVKIIVGGAPLTYSFAEQIKADGYAPDAASAVDLVKDLLNQ
jgi:5-methyltetrahydrofolate--homocysteine methyltransferase